MTALGIETFQLCVCSLLQGARTRRLYNLIKHISCQANRHKAQTRVQLRRCMRRGNRICARGLIETNRSVALVLIKHR